MGSLFGGGGDKAAKSAANAQVEASKEAAAVQREMYQQTRSDLLPYMQQGSRASGLLESILMGIPYNQTAGFSTPPSVLSGGALADNGGTFAVNPAGGGFFTPYKNIDEYSEKITNNPANHYIYDALVKYNPDLTMTTQGIRAAGGEDQYLFKVNQALGQLYGAGVIKPPGGAMVNSPSGNTNIAANGATPADSYLNYGAYAGAADGKNFGITEVDQYKDMLGKLAQGDYSSLYTSPDYQFAVQEGNKAIDRSGSARGMTLSGAQQKAQQRHGQELGSQQFSNYYNRIYGGYNDYLNRITNQAASGQSAAAGLGGIGANSAAGQAAAYQNAGTAKASGITGAYNANQQMYSNIGSGIGGVLGIGSTLAGAAGYSGLGSVLGIGSALFGSDVILKENIVPIGKENGHNIYSFRYKGFPATYVGVMAQEIKETNPEAVEMINGYLAVDYNKIGVNFRRVA